MKSIIYISLIFILSACSGNGRINSRHSEIFVTSEPSSALVYVMGELQGVTPVTINMTRLYPVTYSKENEQLYGRITLKHDDCSERIVKITNRMAGKVLKEKLDCHDNEMVTVNTPILTKKSVRQRLQQLQELKNDGLIDEEEYQKVRHRILESL